MESFNGSLRDELLL
ncbi:hypothetical protein ACFQXB_10115 [Plastorhodobacter daqingensis]|uniref:Uncharacterized protein n=1 Tax=Plastorhodobacter daqingensis TaxID=1387281 RepID=A0ABW2UM03_9RHOB